MRFWWAKTCPILVGPTAGSTSIFGSREGKKRNEGGVGGGGREMWEETKGPEYSGRQLSEKLPRGERSGDSGSICSFKCPKDIKIGLTCPS